MSQLQTSLSSTASWLTGGRIGSSTGAAPSTSSALAGLASVASLGLIGYVIAKNKRYLEPQLLSYVFTHATEGSVDSVIEKIDEFCMSGNWMMHIGPVKGNFLDKTITETKPKIVVELGAYCGYSALRIARQLPTGGHLYSIEIDPLHAAIATKIIEFAGLSDRVTFIVGTVTTKLDSLKTKYGIDRIDLLFLDHAKSLYKSDLILLEQAGLIQSGSQLFADNCGCPGVPDYVSYVSDNNPNYESERIDTYLEYETNIKDFVVISKRK